MALKRKYRSKRKIRRGKYTRRRRTFKARVNQVLNRKVETKMLDIGAENYQLYHNRGTGTGLIPPVGIRSIPVLFNPWAYIEKGPERYERIGDKITPRGMSLKIWLANKFDRPHTLTRIIVALLPRNVGSTVTTADFNPFQVSNLFNCGNRLLQPADSDRGVKFLYDRIHKMNGISPTVNAPAGGSNKEYTKTFKLWIKRKRSSTIIFDSTQQEIINKPIAVYAIPYEQYDTAETSNVASIAVYTRLYYKDF